MEGLVRVFGCEFEYDFMSAWMKYNRMKEGISQEALAHGICSTSLLSYFENGRKRISGEMIEELLKKMKITEIVGYGDIGLVRNKLHKLSSYVESFEHEMAEELYNELLTYESILRLSPYIIEINIYTLMYLILVGRKDYNELKSTLETLDIIYVGLNEELQYIYLLSTGKLLYDYINHSEGISRLKKAYQLKDTPWINYRLGVAYCNNNEYLKSLDYLEKALNVYLMTGYYRNSLGCHSFLGTSYTYLKVYDKAERHLKSVLNGSNYFSMYKNIYSVYTNLANLYFNMGRYKESIQYCQLAMKKTYSTEVDHQGGNATWITPEEPVAAACTYIEANKALNNLSKCKEIFQEFLIPEYENSIYYHYLYALYLSIFHIDEDKFYLEIVDNILPFYKKIGYMDLCTKLQLLLIKYLETRRRYKEANRIYKTLLIAAGSGYE